MMQMPKKFMETLRLSKNEKNQVLIDALQSMEKSG